jgi:Zn-dependent protease with chaperone function
MIDGLGGLILNLWVVAGIAMLLGALLMALVQSRLLAALSCFNAAAKQHFLWAIAAFPLLIGTFAVLLTMTPSVSHALGWSIDHCHFHGDGHGHLCWNHPPTFALLSWKGFFALGFAAFVFWNCLREMVRRYEQQSHLDTLLLLSETRDGQLYIYESDQPHAFTMGMRSPKVLISSGLVKALDPQELDIVCQHEHAHRNCRDPLRLWWFSLLLCVFIPVARRHLRDAMELAIEQLADAKVAASARDSSLVARTLIKVNRLGLRYLKQSPALISCAFCTTAIEARIHQLLAHYQGRRFPLLSFALSAFVVFALGLYFADALHHLIEDLLHHH